MLNNIRKVFLINPIMIFL